MARDFVPVPVWVTNLTTVEPPADDPDPGSMFHFRNQDWFGYANVDGEVFLWQKTFFDVALSANSFINYSRAPRNLVLQNARGEFLQSLPRTSYPAFNPSGSQLFLIAADSTGLRRINLDDEVIWRREFPTLMTCMYLSERYSLVGLLDGTVRMIDDDGSQVVSVVTEGSRVPVVLGCTLDSSAERIGGISGIDPQRAFVYQIRDSQQTDIRYWNLDTEYRREMRVLFSEDDRYLYIEGNQSLLVWNYAAKNVTRLDLAGQFRELCEEGQEGWITVISATPIGHWVQIFHREGALLFEGITDREDMRVQQQGSRMIMSSGSYLVGADYELR